jgi:hypothetical protein
MMDFNSLDGNLISPHSSPFPPFSLLFLTSSQMPYFSSTGIKYEFNLVFKMAPKSREKIPPIVSFASDVLLSVWRAFPHIHLSTRSFFVDFPYSIHL